MILLLFYLLSVVLSYIATHVYYQAEKKMNIHTMKLVPLHIAVVFLPVFNTVSGIVYMFSHVVDHDVLISSQKNIEKFFMLKSYDDKE